MYLQIITAFYLLLTGLTFSGCNCNRLAQVKDKRSSAEGIEPLPSLQTSPLSMSTAPLVAFFDRPSSSVKVATFGEDNASFEAFLKKWELAPKACTTAEILLPVLADEKALKTFDQAEFLKLSFQGFAQNSIDFKTQKGAQILTTFGLLQPEQTWFWTLARNNTEVKTFPMPRPVSFSQITLKTDSETTLASTDLNQLQDVFSLPASKKFTLSWSTTSAAGAKAWIYLFMKDRKNNKKYCLFENTQTTFNFTGESAFPVDSFSLSVFLVSYSYNKDENVLLIGSDHRHIQFR